MAKLTLDDIASGYSSVTKINSNNESIENEFNNKVLYRDNPDGEANHMLNDFDMNSNRILNLSDAQNNGEPVTYRQFLNASGSLEIPTALSSNVTYTPAGTGAVDTDVQTKLRETVSVLDFGAGVGGDVSAEIAAALNSGADRVVIPDGTYTAKNITVTKSGKLIVECYGDITNDGDPVFILNGPSSFTLIGGTYSATDYISNRPVVVDSRNGTSCAFTHIERCTTSNMAICDLGIPSGRTETRVINNVIESDDSTDTYVTNSGTAAVSQIPWINILVDGTVVDARDECKITVVGNEVDVYHQSGSNMDVAKLTGNMKKFKFIDNNIRNRNTASEAEIDGFGGARFSQINDNVFENVGVKVQTHDGGSGVSKAEYTNICRNIWDFEAGCENEWGVLIKSSFINFSSNILRYVDSDRATAKGNFTGVWINELNNSGNGFNDTQPVGIQYTGNIIDVSGASSTTETIQSTIIFNAFASTFTGNTWIGGNVISPPERSVFAGNQFYSLDMSEADYKITKHKIGESTNIISRTYTNLKGPIGTVTGSITSGTDSLVVNSADKLSKNMTISIAGVTGNKVITAISGTTVTIDSNADATVSGAAVTRENDFDDTVKILWYDGNPENNVTADPGALCVDRDGGAGSTLYVKESGTGSTGWVAK